MRVHCDGHPHENNVAARFASVFSRRFFVIFRESSPSRMDFVRLMLFRESSPSRMDFVRVMLFRESSPSWMDFVRVWHFAGVQHHENKFFRESINHHENYPTEASQSKFQLHTWSKYNKFQYTYIHIYRQLIPISMYSNFNPIVQPLQ